MGKLYRWSSRYSLPGWAEPWRWNGWLWEREVGPRVIYSCFLLLFSLEEKIQDLIQIEIPMTNDPSAN